MKTVHADGDCHSRTQGPCKAVGLPTESMHEKTKPQEEKNSKHSSPKSNTQEGKKKKNS